MATKVVSKIAPKAKRTSSRSVTTRRGRDSGGKLVQFFMVDGTSTTLGDDLTYVFTKNIEHARKENRKLFGSVNGIRKK